MTESKKKIDLPFKIVKSEVSGGYIDKVHTAYTGGIDVTNYHEDKYGHFENVPLQSPFTETHVGGKQHRHVEIGSTERPEAFHVEFVPTGVRFYSHKQKNSPPAYWTRDGLAKRAVNLKNIQTTTSSLYVGNYSSNYEVVQTSGRRITNNLIVDGFEASGVLTTQFIYGEGQYSLPELNSVTGSKSIFVERFSAPGGKEESSRGSLDREGEEYSPNSPLPFRNIKMRKPFYGQLSQATPQGGGSIHGVNRNRLVRAGNELVDNGYVSRPIPSTDIQYSWVTASSITTAAELGGYQPYGGNSAGDVFTDITFISGSLVKSGSNTQYFVDNLYINSLAKDSKKIDLQTNTFSMSGSLSSSLSEHVNSPYTYTTWTSLRNSEGPVSKALRANNIISVQAEPKERIIQSRISRKRIFLKPKRAIESVNYVDPPVTFKYKPLKHRFVFVGTTNPDVGQEMVHTYVNNLSTFANKELIKRLSLKEDKQQFYNLIYDYYTQGDQIENNPIERFLGYNYTETVWPREENTGLAKTRKRAAYYLDRAGFDRDGYDRQLGTQRVFWRDSQEDRKRSRLSEGGYYSSIGYLSTEESGSSFISYLSRSLLDDNRSYVEGYSEYIQNSNFDEGLFNSLILLESDITEEKELYSFYMSSSAITNYAQFYQQYNPFEKVERGYKLKTAGEFSNIYIDFYEQNTSKDLNYKKSIGALYRNTFYSYKSKQKPAQFGNYSDISLKLPSDEIEQNPKIKYLSFIGGSELNTGSFFQNESFFSNQTGANSFFSDSIRAAAWVEVQNDAVYGLIQADVYGTLKADLGVPAVSPLNNTFFILFKLDLQENKFEKIATLKMGLQQTAANVGQKLIVANVKQITDENDQIIFDLPSNRHLVIFEIDLITKQFTQVLNLDTGQPDPFNNFSNAPRIYGADPGTNKILFYSNYDLATTTNPSNLFVYNVSTQTFSQSNAYLAALVNPYEQTTVASFRSLSKNLKTPGKCFFSTTGATIGTYPSPLVTSKFFVYDFTTDSVTNLDFVLTSQGLTFAPSWCVYVSYQNKIWIKWIGSPVYSMNLDGTGLTSLPDFETLYPEISGCLNFISFANLSGSTILFTPSGYRLSSTSNDYQEFRLAFLDLDTNTITFKKLDNPWNPGSFNRILHHINIYNGKIYSSNNVSFQVYYSTIMVYDLDNETGFFPLGQDNRYLQFNKLYFSENTQKTDFIFSTMDNGLLYYKENSNKKPFFDSYENYYQEIASLVKDRSVIPEFKIADHLEFYVKQNNKNFRSTNKQFLLLDGAEKYNSSNNNIQYEKIFLNTYATSDILKKQSNLVEENKDLSILDNINIKISGIKKLLPYNGFYPEHRITQIAGLYSELAKQNFLGGNLSINYYNNDQEKVLYNNYEDFLSSSASNTPFSEFVASIAFKNKNYVFFDQEDHTSDNLYSIYMITSSTEDPFSEWSAPQRIYSGSASDYYGRSNFVLAKENTLTLFWIRNNIFLTYISTTDEGNSWTYYSVNSEYPSFFVAGGTHLIRTMAGIDDDKTDTTLLFLAQERGLAISDIYITILKITQDTISPGHWLFEEEHSFSLTKPNTNNQLIFGSDIVSSSVDYQIFFGYDGFEFPTGSIMLVTGSPDSGWSSPISICKGKPKSIYQTQIGDGGISATYFKDKVYVFFGAAYEEIEKDFEGSVRVVTSSLGGVWPTIDTDLPARLIYNTSVNNDEVPAYRRNDNVKSFAGTDDRLYYGIGNAYNFQYTSIFAFGSTDGIEFQTSENGLLYEKRVSMLGWQIGKDGTGEGPAAVSILPYEEGGKILPAFIYLDSCQPYNATTGAHIQAIKSTKFINYSIEVENSIKNVVDTSLEPFFAPGILYNTIKSGISVDWPCATGSTAIINPYNSLGVVNKYYPQPIEMFSYSGSNIQQTIYGNLRSNIDYRIPFENLLFPNEAFVSKDIQTENISVISTTTLDSVENEEFIEKIKDCYISGEYQPYTSLSDLFDINNLGPKRFSVPFVYRKNNSQDTGLYTLAMSNFLAETVKFFLKDEKMVTFTSEPDYKWSQFSNNITYYMDVVVEKTPELVMMEAYHSDKHPIGPNGEKMNGRYFGYPVNKTDKTVWGGAEFTEEEARLIHNDPAYAPYTPPYFEGEARARLSFTPNNSRQYTLQEIFDELQIENIFLDVAKGATIGSDAYLNKMPVGSSIEILGSAQSVEVTIDETSGEKTVREMPDSQTWILSPKMETPVLDFSSQALVPYENNYSKTGGFGKGMWSGYGQIPQSGSGVKVRLEYPFITNTSPLTASLLEQVGFKAEERNVGQLAETKLIKEAIVLIPYLETVSSENKKIILKNSTGFNFIKIDKKKFKQQKQNIEQGLPAVPKDTEKGIKRDILRTSISEMITKMKDYVIPPEMNFLEYSDIAPFVMYIFEFEHTLDQQDLADIWQSLMPKISYTAEEQEVSITHKNSEHEFFEGKGLPDNLRWLVFKVKKKAEYNYFNVTATTKDDSRFDFNKIIGRKEGTDVYSYNWPYDYFSLVEFAKVELSLDYIAKAEEETEE